MYDCSSEKTENNMMGFGYEETATKIQSIISISKHHLHKAKAQFFSELANFQQR